MEFISINFWTYMYFILAGGMLIFFSVLAKSLKIKEKTDKEKWEKANKSKHNQQKRFNNEELKINKAVIEVELEKEKAIFLNNLKDEKSNIENENKIARLNIEEEYKHKLEVQQKLYEEEKVRIQKYIGVTELATYFKITGAELNQIMKELKWAEKSGKWWTATKLGKEKGAEQKYNDKSKQQYILWNENVKYNKQLIDAINMFEKTNISKPYKKMTDKERKDKGDKFEAHVSNIYRTNSYVIWEHGKDKGLLDAGIDIFAKKDNEYLFIQCKNWESWSITEDDIIKTRNQARKYLIDNPKIFKLLKTYNLKIVYITSKDCLNNEAKNYIDLNDKIEHKIIEMK